MRTMLDILLVLMGIAASLLSAVMPQDGLRELLADFTRPVMLCKWIIAILILIWIELLID